MYYVIQYQKIQEGVIKIPTVTKISKDMILDTAFEIARTSGLDKVSNREIAKRLNCSIRPIYYQFRDVQEMNSELIKKIWQYFYDYIFTKRDENIPDYKKTGINYIDFACNEKELFKILFMTNDKYLPDDDENFKKISMLIKESGKVKDNEIKTFHYKMWIFTHGLASLLATNVMILTQKQINDLLTEEFTALIELEKKEGNINE